MKNLYSFIRARDIFAKISLSFCLHSSYYFLLKCEKVTNTSAKKIHSKKLAIVLVSHTQFSTIMMRVFRRLPQQQNSLCFSLTNNNYPHIQWFSFNVWAFFCCCCFWINNRKYMRGKYTRMAEWWRRRRRIFRIILCWIRNLNAHNPPKRLNVCRRLLRIIKMLTATDASSWREVKISISRTFSFFLFALWLIIRRIRIH